MSFIKKISSINFCGNFGDPTNCTEMIDIVEYFYENNNEIKIEILLIDSGHLYYWNFLCANSW